MRLDQITRPVFAAAYQRLAVSYNHRLAAADLEAVLTANFDQVRGMPESAVVAGIDHLVREPLRFFPKAGELRRACREALARQEGQHQRQHGTDAAAGTICPHCRREPWAAGYEMWNGVVLGRMRCACPQAGTGWDTDAARGWQDAGVAPYQMPARHVARGGEPLPVLPPPDAGDAWEAEEAT